TLVVKDGFFFRRCDSRKIQRYRCKICYKKFSNATFSPAKNQKKRRFNHTLLLQLASGISQNRAAILHKCHPVTIKRKFEYLAKRSRIKNRELLKSLYQDQRCTEVQFDDLITIEHTKLKPLSVTVIVDKKTRRVLGTNIATIGAFGHLAKISLNKYGKRINNHIPKMHELFKSVENYIHPLAIIESDVHKFYPQIVKAHFPSSTHITFPGGKSSIAGQGELKKLKFDPLFCINHSNAMLRANINRLFRRTWNTTKRIEQLQKHLDIYCYAFNSGLIR
ncbi:MAG: transposase, partial [Halobacteriovoraceae bacterium]|nr:transposase [Halobacteriovoraceae bacterium]